MQLFSEVSRDGTATQTLIYCNIDHLQNSRDTGYFSLTLRAYCTIAAENPGIGRKLVPRCLVQ